MAGAISGMMDFDSVADADAKMRRDQVNGQISQMMNDQGAPAGGFMPGIEGEGLSPDRFARTYSETGDTRNFRQQDPLGSFKVPMPGAGSADRNNIVIPGDRLNFDTNQDEFKDRARLRARKDIGV